MQMITAVANYNATERIIINDFEIAHGYLFKSKLRFKQRQGNTVNAAIKTGLYNKKLLALKKSTAFMVAFRIT